MFSSSVNSYVLSARSTMSLITITTLYNNHAVSQSRIAAPGPLAVKQPGPSSSNKPKVYHYRSVQPARREDPADNSGKIKISVSATDPSQTHRPFAAVTVGAYPLLF